MDEDALSRRLQRLAEVTKSAGDLPAGWWVGDTAGERQVRDDLAAGRLNWKAAHQFATKGIKALEAGDRTAAEEYAWMATDLFIAAVVTRLRPSDIAVLERPARPRGRPRGSKNRTKE